MKKVFLDTNIFIDILEERRFSESSKAVVSKGQEGIFSMYASLLSLVNIAYIRRKHSVNEIYANLNSLRSMLHVVPIDEAQLDAALNIKIKKILKITFSFSAPSLRDATLSSQTTPKISPASAE